MPANLPAEYYSVEKEYHEAKSKEAKIIALQKMLSVIPKHKGTEKLVSEIKSKIAKLKKEIQKEEKKSKARKRGIRKEGAAQVCLIGFPNSGKSYILNKLCNKNIASTEIPFETVNPEVGMLDIDGVKIQLVEIPSVHPNFYEKRGDLKSIIFTTDAICFLADTKEEFQALKKEIDTFDKPYVVCSSKKLDELKEKIWKMLNLIKVYTKEPGSKPEKEPVALKVGSTVEDLGKEIHKDFVKKFRYAKIYRKKGKVKQLKVGLNFKLEDEDIVEFHLR